jgi:hypothetical protein
VHLSHSIPGSSEAFGREAGLAVVEAEDLESARLCRSRSMVEDHVH